MTLIADTSGRTADADQGRRAEAIRAEIRRAMRDGRFGGRDLARSVPEVMGELHEAEVAYARASSLARALAARVFAPVDAGHTRAAFASPGYALMVRECEAATAKADAALDALAAIESDALAMLQPDPA